MRAQSNFLIKFLLTTSFTVLLSIPNAAAQTDAALVNTAPIGKLPTTVQPLDYHIELTIDPEKEFFTGNTTIRVHLNEEANHVWLHGQGLTVNESSVKSLSDRELKTTYKQLLDTGVAKVTFPETLAAGEYELSFSYRAKVSEAPQGAFRAIFEEQSYWATQFQTTYARQVFPSFDEPRFKQPFRMTIITPEDTVAITNTPVESTTKTPEGWVRHRFAPTKPLPTYLVAFAVGPYEINDYGTLPSNDIREHPLPFRGLTGQGKGAEMDFALTQTEHVLGALERYFDSPYPYMKLDYTVPPTRIEFAMENPGAVLFDEYFMLLNQDSPAQQMLYYYALNAHELAHMWFGNLVTPEWWDDLWLNESFATWLAVKTVNEVWPEGGFQNANVGNGLFAMKKDSLASVRRVRQPIERNEDIVFALDSSITYFKGSALLRMLEKHVGEDNFRDGIIHHTERFRHGTATTEDFIESLSSSGKNNDLSAILTSFIEQPGVPVVEVDILCDSQPIEARITQSRYAPLGSLINQQQTWTIPVCLSTDQGRHCKTVTQTQTKMPINGEACPSFIHPNPNGSYYRFTMSEESWINLIQRAEKLSAIEALTAVDSLDAALQSGSVTPSVWLNGLSAFSKHTSLDVVEAAFNRFEATSKRILSARDLSFAREHSRNLFLPVYNALRERSDIPAENLRSSLLTHLVSFAQVPSLRDVLVSKAKTAVQLDGDFVTAELPQEQRKLALKSAVQTLDESFYQKLLALTITSKDHTFTSNAVIALAATTNTDHVPLLLQQVENDKFALGDKLDLMYALFENEQAQDIAFSWLKENVDTLFAAMPATWRAYWLPGLGTNFCSTEMATSWEAFVLSKKDQMNGYEQSLKNTVEQIELCAAVTESLEEQMTNALRTELP